MRKVGLLIGLMLGAGVGLLASLTDGIGLKIIMMAIGAVAGVAIGGAFSRPRKHNSLAFEADDSYGLGTCAEDRMRNFWRDRGKVVPFSGPPDPEGTRHDFDRERY